MNLNLKEAIMKRGLKQKYIAHAMNIDPVVFSKKLIGDLSFTKGEQAQISKLLREKIRNLFPNTRGA
jgi:hypothetical protein